MVPLRLSLIWFTVILCSIIHVNCELEEYFKWKQISYASVQQDGDILFPRLTGDESKDYIPYNNVPMGAIRYKDQIFVCVPRRRPGVPSTLNFVHTKSSQGSSPSLRSFPNEEMNNLHPNLQPDPNRIVSVYRPRVDDCNRLWFIDTGMLEYPNNTRQVQRAAIWIYDLENSRVLHRFEIEQNIVATGNGLASITVDVDSNNCQNAYAYIPDLAHNRLYVYSLSQNRIWTFRHNYFSFDPLHGDFDVAGVQFQWDDGIFSITMGRRQSDGYRTVYFHAMASTSEFSVSSRVLQDESRASRDFHGNDFKFLGMRGSRTQSTMHEYDRNSGIIFYAQVQLNAVGCWNSNTQLTPNSFHILAQNNRTMIYPSDLNIDRDGNLWVLTNTMPRFLYAELNPNEFNFRLWRASARDIAMNSLCADPRSNNQYMMTVT